jgi:glycosyltransferase involved in cell wall biosynthesis
MKQYKVKMTPMPDNAGGPSGIRTVIESYVRLGSQYGIEFVSAGEDVGIVHAGMGGSKGERSMAEISMLHGIYFTAEYDGSRWERKANHRVIENLMSAASVTVPSDWVAKTLRKEFKIDPYILEHGVFWEEWQHENEYNPRVVFWGKNRIFNDVCDPGGLVAVAEQMPDFHFLTTLAPETVPSNVHALGVMPHEQVKKVIQRSAIVLSTIKETWGLLYIEALASGTPVVTLKNGHVPNLVEHGISGYHYKPYDINDMERGIRWCAKHRNTLSVNAKLRAKQYSWDSTMLRLRDIIEVTLEKNNE